MSSSEFIRRHSRTVRLTHWVNALVLVLLLMSGLQIFNAHPTLYWGNRSDFEAAWLKIESVPAEAGQLVGITTLFGHDLKTTGLLGASRDPEGVWLDRAFPTWATVPSPQWLAMARRWHFFFAWAFVINGLIYVAYSLASRHLSRDLLPSVRDLRGIMRAILDHLTFHHPRGEAAKRYNVLQKLAYLTVIYGLGPLMVLTGLAMSPWLNAVFPGLPELFGGRQSARSIHFLSATGLVGFFLIHLFMVLVTGVWNNLRSMITGRYRIRTGE